MHFWPKIKNQSDMWATKQRGLTFWANVYMYKYDCVATYSWYFCHCTNGPLSLHNRKLSLHILCITAHYFMPSRNSTHYWLSVHSFPALSTNILPGDATIIFIHQ